MGIFGGSSNPFDPLVEKVTDEKNTAEDWGMIMSVCDRVGATTSGPKECLRAVIKRLNHQDPHVVMQAITLLDACANNCGRQFLLEVETLHRKKGAGPNCGAQVASREFETEYRRLLSRTQHPRIAEKLKAMLKSWAEGEFSKAADGFMLSDPWYTFHMLQALNLSPAGTDCQHLTYSWHDVKLLGARIRPTPSSPHCTLG